MASYLKAAAIGTLNIVTSTLSTGSSVISGVVSRTAAIGTAYLGYLPLLQQAPPAPLPQARPIPVQRRKRRPTTNPVESFGRAVGTAGAPHIQAAVQQVSAPSKSLAIIASDIVKKKKGRIKAAITKTFLPMLTKKLGWLSSLGRFKQFAVFALRDLSTYTAAQRKPEVRLAQQRYTQMVAAFRRDEIPETYLKGAQAAYEKSLIEALTNDGCSNIQELKEMALNTVEQNAGKLFIENKAPISFLKNPAHWLANFFESFFKWIFVRKAKSEISKGLESLMAKLKVSGSTSSRDDLLEATGNGEQATSIPSILESQSEVFIYYMMQKLMHSVVDLPQLSEEDFRLADRTNVHIQDLVQDAALLAPEALPVIAEALNRRGDLDEISANLIFMAQKKITESFDSSANEILADLLSMAQEEMTELFDSDASEIAAELVLMAQEDIIELLNNSVNERTVFAEAAINTLGLDDAAQRLHTTMVPWILGKA